MPCDGVIGATRWLGSEYFTVNPMAVRTPSVDVYTENRRAVTEILSTHVGYALMDPSDKGAGRG